MNDNKQDNFDGDLDLDMWFKAMTLCREHANGKRGVKDIIECPKCGGKLHYSIASCNGHLWGKCETENCLAWMQ